MTRDDAVRAAAYRVVTSAALLAARRALDASSTLNDAQLAKILAVGVVAGWSDETTFGSADARGVTVSPRAGGPSVRVRWDDLARVVRRGLAVTGADRLTHAYRRYATAAADAGAAQRCRERLAVVELAQIRAEILAAGLDGVPAQQPLFDLPPTNARGRP